MENFIMLNPAYMLRHDLKRSFIVAHENTDTSDSFFKSSKGCFSMIHPVYAMTLAILSKPIKLENAFEEVAYFLDIPIKESKNIINSMLNNSESVFIDYGGNINRFPKNTIIYADSINNNFLSEEFKPEQFVFDELDFSTIRPFKAPVGIVFMINNNCATDCIYCYADRSTKNKKISFDLLKQTIKNSYYLGLKEFVITGGEFFLYKKWRELLAELLKYDYKPDIISTKVPITEKDIIDFKPSNVTVQVSLDSLNSGITSSVLNVKEMYLEQIKETISLLDKHNVKFQVATILTVFNSNVEDLENLYTFLKKFKSLARWEIRVAFSSLYSRVDFNKIKITKHVESDIEEWINKIKDSSELDILWSPDYNDTYFKSTTGSSAFIGSRCSANLSHMVILPDGKVTICEQLYWDDRFIIGNINNQTISEVWNSDRALKLATLARNDIRKNSVCHNCEIFEDCFSHHNICYANVMKAYGKENWDFPDPRCNKAPNFLHNIAITSEC